MPKTGLYLLQGISPAQVAASPFDVRVIDAYDEDGTLWTRDQVTQMGGGSADPHLLLGYFSIGEAETYRDYFKTIPASALGPENPQWKGNFEVAYWTDAWRQVATTYVDNLIKAGYDGAYFDVVDEYQTAWAKSHVADPAQAMADLVKYLADHARAQNPNFKIWVNNAEELLTKDTYFNAIDGMFKENLYYTDSGQKQPSDETAHSLGLMNKMLAAGKDVIAIEYVSGSDKVADVHAQADRDGLGSYVAHLDLDGIDYEGVRPGVGAPTNPAEPASPAPADPVTGPDAPIAGTPSTPAPEDGTERGTDERPGAHHHRHDGHSGGEDPLASLDDSFVFRGSDEACGSGRGSHRSGEVDAGLDPMGLYLQHGWGSHHHGHHDAA
ncbi:endo alpha-1,4 polygalactosaminidase [Methylobacterium segetis]|uniref:endo alpha-1,4 polygalactosaminidase n=1 Tax=Methylobacterium segetis TaxID=2488750 RepID=UPI0010515396|nr:endo alpha-1,4 polygalactosaminidase [Methylobacterium segetis]